MTVEIKGDVSMVMHRSPEIIWDFITDPKSWKLLTPLKKSEFATSSKFVGLGSKIHMELDARGVNTIIDLKLTEFNRPYKMAWEGRVVYPILFGLLRPPLRIAGFLEFDKVGSGTSMRIYQDFFAPKSLLGDIAFFFLNKTLKLKNVIDDTMYLLLASFQIKLEEYT